MNPRPPKGKHLVCPVCGEDAPADGSDRCLRHDRFYVPARDHKRMPRDRYLGARIGGKYRLLGLLGEGGMANVYIGVQEPVERDVAVKVVAPDVDDTHAIRERFYREAQIVAGLRHPNILTLYDFGTEEDGTLYMVTELVQGRALSQVIKKEGPLPVDRTMRITRQVMAALAEAHGRGLIHRDIKPENIMLQSTTWGGEQALVLDFGIAKPLDWGGQRQQRLTQAGISFGTPAYMSPEQIQGRRDFTFATDIYSLGIVVYEMLTGDLPFVGDSFIETMMAHRNRPLPRLPSELGVPPIVEDVLRRATLKEPAQRFRNASAALRALDACLARAGLLAGGGGALADMAGVGSVPEVISAPGPARARSSAPSPDEVLSPGSGASVQGSSPAPSAQAPDATPKRTLAEPSAPVPSLVPQGARVGGPSEPTGPASPAPDTRAGESDPSGPWEPTPADPSDPSVHARQTLVVQDEEEDEEPVAAAFGCQAAPVTGPRAPLRPEPTVVVDPGARVRRGTPAPTRPGRLSGAPELDPRASKPAGSSAEGSRTDPDLVAYIPDAAASARSDGAPEQAGLFPTLAETLVSARAEDIFGPGPETTRVPRPPASQLRRPGHPHGAGGQSADAELDAISGTRPPPRTPVPAAPAAPDPLLRGADPTVRQRRAAPVILHEPPAGRPLARAPEQGSPLQPAPHSETLVLPAEHFSSPGGAPAPSTAASHVGRGARPAEGSPTDSGAGRPGPASGPHGSAVAAPAAAATARAAAAKRQSRRGPRRERNARRNDATPGSRELEAPPSNGLGPLLSWGLLGLGLGLLVLAVVLLISLLSGS